ncbi:MAG: hypothetical protein OEW48_20090, partial [Phycisphaerae bacterium]|nr:hypothetical protein [Phycisphaerae bacterium]
MHSLWQGILIGLLAAVALSFLRSSKATIRYAVSCTAMAAVIAAAAVTAVSVWPDGRGPAEQDSALLGEPVGGEAGTHIGVPSATTSPAGDVSSSGRWWQHPSVSRYIVLIWVAGVMLFSIYHLFGWRRARGFVKRGTSP